MIDMLPFTTKGNNVLASVAGSDSGATSCDLVQETSSTLWYKVSLQANGAACVKAELNTDYFDTVLAVYSSLGSCQDLGCMYQSYSYHSVMWKAEEGESYYVVVASYYYWTSGPFRLRFSVRLQQSCTITW